MRRTHEEIDAQNNRPNILSRLLRRFNIQETRICYLESEANDTKKQLDEQHRQIEKLAAYIEDLSQEQRTLRMRQEFELPQPNWED